MSASDIPQQMRVVEIREPGGPDALVVAERPVPVPGPGEILIRVVATGFNGADAAQRAGAYPPPPGASDLPGLECSGTVAATGEGAHRFSIGDEVCALLAGGGYAEFVAVPEVQVLPVPAGISLVDAAAIPEVACTVLSNFAAPELPGPGRTVLVHGGSGGLGSFAIGFAAALGCRVLATAGSSDGVAHALDAGADAACDYHERDFTEFVADETGGTGVDLVLDVVGGPYLADNLRSLAIGGRLAVISVLGGPKAEVNLGVMMRRRLTISATTLRARPVTGPGSKAEIVRAVESTVWPLIANGRIRTAPTTRMPLDEASTLHAAHADRTLAPGKAILVV